MLRTVSGLVEASNVGIGLRGFRTRLVARSGATDRGGVPVLYENAAGVRELEEFFLTAAAKAGVR